MLHAVFATHLPDTCPAGHAAPRKTAVEGLTRLMEELPSRGMSLVGGWANQAAHGLYLIIDAPNAHDVNKAVMEFGLGRWNTLTINPVITVDQLRGALEQAIIDDPL
ncbi:MAG: DUF3303 family protein [Chloroflexota bacterium]